MVDKRISFLITVFLVGIVFWPRVLALDSFRSPDEDRWQARAEGFRRDLALGRWSELLKSPTPGVTTQWLGSLTLHHDTWAAQKQGVVVGHSILILIAGYLFWRLWGGWAGSVLVVLLTFNPLLYAHSRVFGTDSLLSLCLVISVGLLLLWHQSRAQRYLIAAALFGAAAALSKVPGLVIVPFSVLALAYWLPPQRDLSLWVRTVAIWLVAFCIGLALILPSIVFAPASVIGDFSELFRSDEVLQLHQRGYLYYVGSLIFFSTPVQWLGLILALAILLPIRVTKAVRPSRSDLVVLLVFALVFLVGMSLGGKKGDRYILPSFVALDVISAAVIAGFLPYALKTFGIHFTSWTRTHLTSFILACVLLCAVTWQALFVWQSHPHTLSYVNPLARSWFAERRHGWGEGLDLAAAYLNEKPNATNLKTASFYPNEFGEYFVGETVPAHKHDEASVDYVVLYRAMLQRGASAWETDVLNAYQTRTPEKVVRLSDVEMAWIYSVKE